MAFCPSCGNSTGNPPPDDEESRVKLATVLFGDVKGFTAMSEHLPPEQVTKIMNECFDALTEVIVKYDGEVLKYIGDAIMASFGYPKAHEDDPVRAVQAGLEMQRALARFAAKLEAERGFSLDMRIGINSGQVFVAKVGSGRFQKFDLMGNTVNLASRLEHHAEPGSVLVGETSYRLARHAFEFEAQLPRNDIKGIEGEVKTFVPLRPKLGGREARSGRELRLVGRDAELTQLDAYLSEAQAGQGRLIAVVADPGVGKSRLVEEFCKRHQDEDVTRVYAAAPSFGESMPYSMLTGFIRSLLFGDAADEEITEGGLRAKLAVLLPDGLVSNAVAVLDDLLGIAGYEQTAVSQLEARSRRDLLTNSLKHVVRMRSQQRMLLLNLEDMHWADKSSLDVLSEILTGIQNQRVMALLTYRPWFKHGWASRSFYREVRLQELPPACAKALLTEFFGSKAIPAEIGQPVIEKAGGNPFFLEQLLNTLVQSEVVVQSDGRWVLNRDRDISALAVPDTIQEILQARIDQLARGPRSVLQVAAVIGREFMYRLLETVTKAVTDVGYALDEHLRPLTDQEFVCEKSYQPELEYMFTHALTQDVVYHGLPEARRKVLHEQVAEAMEQLGIWNEELLAVHYEKTDNRTKALKSALGTAEKARKNYANHEAVEHYSRALELLEKDPEGDSAQKRAVLEALGDLSKLLGNFDRAEEYYSRAKEESTNPSDTARLWRKLGDLAQSRGRTGEAGAAYRAAEHALQDVDDPAEQVNVFLAQARMDRLRGVLESASSASKRALSLLNRVDDLTSASVWFELGEVEREKGNLVAASVYLQQAADTWQQMNWLEKLALARSALADVSFNRGELREALDYFEGALRIQDELLDREGKASSLAGIGRIRMSMGELDAATKCLAEALAIAEEIDSRPLAARCQLQLGIICLERGDLKGAQALIDAGYTGFKRIRNWRGSAYALVARARLYRAKGDPDHARTRLQKAWNLAEEMEDQALLAQISVNQAELEEEAGRLERAAERATAGIHLARTISDQRLVARAERILGRVRARQGQITEALELLSSSVATLRRVGAQIDAARAALDYAIAASRAPSAKVQQNARGMLALAITTFEQNKATHETELARAVAQRMTGQAATRS